MALKAYTVGKIDISLQNSTGKGIWDTIYYKRYENGIPETAKSQAIYHAVKYNFTSGQVYSVTEQDQSQTI